MEYADNGDLYHKITEYQKKGSLMSENEIWNIFIQVCLHPVFIINSLAARLLKG